MNFTNLDTAIETAHILTDLKNNPLKVQEYEENLFKLFDLFKTNFPIIEIPSNTIMFHSNQFFCRDVLEFEPIGSSMLIQEFKRYNNKIETFKGSEFPPFSEVYSRVYCNFTPNANMEVKANRNTSEHVYITTKPMFFFQIPDYKNRCLKDIFELTQVKTLKKYIRKINSENKVISGIITITTVDNAPHNDPNATSLKLTNGAIIYPELIILDGFSYFKKISQFDLYDLKEHQIYEYLQNGVIIRKNLRGLSDDVHIKEIYLDRYMDEIHDYITIGEQTSDEHVNKIDSIEKFSTFIEYEKKNIGIFGSKILYAYIFKNYKNTYNSKNAFFDAFSIVPNYYPIIQNDY